jgi:lipid-A-disaccharide synthase
VNLIAQRRLVPELLQGRFTAGNVASALAPLLAEGPERDRQLAGLAEVRDRLTLPGAGSPIDRVAEAVLALLPS